MSNDHNRDSDHANDNGEHERLGGKQVASASAGGALTSLAALSAALNKIDVAAIAGRSGLPLLQFRSRENNGTWSYGQRRTIPENGSRWAVNPLTFVWGYVCFGPDKTKPPLGERLVSVSQPKPEVADLPDTGFPWSEQWGVHMKCLDGPDGGVEVFFKTTTDGGIQAVAGLIEATRNQINGGQHDGKVAPVVQLEKDSYQHGQYGRVWTPVLTIVDWMPLDGPAPTPAPVSPPPPTEQPRRRRVA